MAVAEGPAAGSRPLYVLEEFDWWTARRPVVFAFYDDGSVIFRSGSDGKYRIAQLDSAGSKALEHELKAPADFAGSYDFAPSIWSHPPVVTARNWINGPEARLTLFGYAFEGGIRQLSSSVGSARGPRSCEPAWLDQYVTRFGAFSAQGARDWTAEWIELRLAGYEYARTEPPLQWPSDFPDLDDRWSVRHDDPTSAEMYLESEFENRLTELLRSRETRQAILISGKRWSVESRMVFPAETNWYSTRFPLRPRHQQPAATTSPQP